MTGRIATVLMKKLEWPATATMEMSSRNVEELCQAFRKQLEVNNDDVSFNITSDGVYRHLHKDLVRRLNRLARFSYPGVIERKWERKKLRKNWRIR